MDMLLGFLFGFVVISGVVIVARLFCSAAVGIARSGREPPRVYPAAPPRLRAGVSAPTLIPRPKAPPRPMPATCGNCGAPFEPRRCSYCGTVHDAGTPAAAIFTTSQKFTVDDMRVLSQQWTEATFKKVCLVAIQRADARGLVDWGIGPHQAFPTDLGRDLLDLLDWIDRVVQVLQPGHSITMSADALALAFPGGIQAARAWAAQRGMVIQKAGPLMRGRRMRGVFLLRAAALAGASAAPEPLGKL